MFAFRVFRFALLTTLVANKITATADLKKIKAQRTAQHSEKQSRNSVLLLSIACQFCLQALLAS